jgi:type III secretion protein R
MPDPIGLILGLLSLSLVPFFVIMATSFIKITIVFSLVRNALGVQQIPPNIALYGIALILTIYIMTPILGQIYDFYIENNIDYKDTSSLYKFWEFGLGPLRSFLSFHSQNDNVNFFMTVAKEIWPEKYLQYNNEESFIILLPSFAVSEITIAFEIGFLLYLPFIAIDLIISNILLAMGMMMVSPMTISLPFKLLLFVLVNGWVRIVQGIINSYMT